MCLPSNVICVPDKYFVEKYEIRKTNNHCSPILYLVVVHPETKDMIREHLNGTYRVSLMPVMATDNREHSFYVARSSVKDTVNAMIDLGNLALK